MNIMLHCAESELNLLQMEIESLQICIVDPCESEFLKCAAELRIQILKFGVAMLQEIILKQLLAVDIETVLGQIQASQGNKK